MKIKNKIKNLLNLLTPAKLAFIIAVVFVISVFILIIISIQFVTLNNQQQIRDRKVDLIEVTEDDRDVVNKVDVIDTEVLFEDLSDYKFNNRIVTYQEIVNGSFVDTRISITNPLKELTFKNLEYILTDVKNYKENYMLNLVLRDSDGNNKYIHIFNDEIIEVPDNVKNVYFVPFIDTTLFFTTNDYIENKIQSTIGKYNIIDKTSEILLKTNIEESFSVTPEIYISGFLPSGNILISASSGSDAGPFHDWYVFNTTNNILEDVPFYNRERVHVAGSLSNDGRYYLHNDFKLFPNGYNLDSNVGSDRCTNLYDFVTNTKSIIYCENFADNPTYKFINGIKYIFKGNNLFYSNNVGIFNYDIQTKKETKISDFTFIDEYHNGIISAFDNNNLLINNGKSDEGMNFEDDFKLININTGKVIDLELGNAKLIGVIESN